MSFQGAWGWIGLVLVLSGCHPPPAVGAKSPPPRVDEKRSIIDVVEISGYQVVLDRGAQRIGVHMSPPTEVAHQGQFGGDEAPLSATMGAIEGDSRFVSASALAIKAKQFDDGLYAAVELAVDSGLGRFPSRQRWLQELRGIAEAGAASDVLAIADHLGSGASLSARAAAIAKPYATLRPLGLYEWSEQLGRVFRRDRYLQQELDPSTAVELAELIASSAARHEAFDSMVALTERLTNPVRGADLRPLVDRLARGQGARFSDPAPLFPTSRSHEVDLLERMFQGGPIPDDVRAIDLVVAAIRANTIDLRPNATSGWYDHQVHALAPLLIPERMPEAVRLDFSKGYKKELEGLFRALLAMTRETHIKQVGMMWGGGVPELIIKPGLTVEPTAAFYLRRAYGYAFVERVVRESFGRRALETMHRMTDSGPVDANLADELIAMKRLFYGAYLQVCEEIELEPQRADGLDDAPAARVTFREWAASHHRDPDLAKDMRMMVPIAYDPRTKESRVWAILGFTKRVLEVGFTEPPEVVEIREHGEVSAEAKPRDVDFREDRHGIARPVMVELSVTNVLSREQLRKLCDEYETQTGIVAQLTSPAALTRHLGE